MFTRIREKSVLSQMNPVHTLTPYFFKIEFSILPPRPVTDKNTDSTAKMSS